MNTFLLTASTLLLRMVGMLFQAWIASHIGAEGIGLYQLSGSVTVLFNVFAVSGVRFAATKLISEEAASCRGDVPRAVRICILYALLFGVLSSGTLLYSAEPLGFLWIGDARIVLSLRFAACSMPFIALEAVFSGYFTACGRIWKIVLIQLLSSIVCVTITLYLLKRSDFMDLERSCAAITVGNVIAEMLCSFSLLFIYLHERRQWHSNLSKSANLFKRMLSAAVPLGLSSYVRTGLSTLEHMMIPKGLRLAGLSAEAAISGYGIVHGMALSAVLFPACLLFSLADLVVPELTRSQISGQTKRIQHIIHLSRTGTLLYAVGTAVMMFALADVIADHIFHTPECAKVIRTLAPLIPIMNLDTITDGCLRGLGQQSVVMAINILDAALGVALVYYLLPNYGTTGYILMIWITEAINCLLSSCALKHAIRKSSASSQ